ncbi:hypothetical protein D3C87_2169480 [compost metagenome]
MLAGEGVEGAERFIEQQDAWAGHQAAGNRHALGHAAGKLMRVGAGEVCEAHQLDELVDTPLPLVFLER